MAVSLDLRTLLACLLLGNGFTVLLVLAYRSHYPKEATTPLYLASKILQLAAALLLLLENTLGLPFTVPCIILLSLAGAALEALALLKKLEADSRWVKRIYGVLAGLAAIGLLLLHTDAPRLVAAAALTGALLLIYPAYVLSWKLRKTPLQEMAGLLYGAVILSLLGKAGGLFYPLPEGPGAGGWVEAFFCAGIYLLMFLGTAGFLLISRELSYAELERVATYDELTGVLNRRAFLLRAQPLIAAAAREMTPVSFLLLDVDHFKQVNDTYGHDTGDRVLQDFARRIERELDSGDLFGRFGGEEFAVLLHRPDEEAGGQIAEGLRRCVLDATIEGMPFPYTVSIGLITVGSRERVPLNTLYKLSDTALYEAKQQGRNCVVRSNL